MTNPSFRRASFADLEVIDRVYQKCISDLLSKQIFQWDAKYPHKSYLEESIKNQELYVLEAAGALAASVVLNRNESPEWKDICWTGDKATALVVHALAVDPVQQGKGWGKILMRFAEQYALENGFNTLRIDVFPRNPVAVPFYKKLGFKYRGKVHFDFKPPGRQEYHCYEKKIQH